MLLYDEAHHLSADSSVALCHDPLVMSHAQLGVQHVVLS